MRKKLTNLEFLQRLEDLNIKYVPLEEYKGMDKKIKWLCCKNSGHIFEQSPSEIIYGKSGCPYCSRKRVFIGETDLWTTHPEIAKMLKNYDDGYKFTSGSGVKVDWICPICGKTIKEKTIEKVVKNGLSCQYCSDGISYAEKFMMNVLSQLKIDFKREEVFDWSHNKKYDFYIKSLNLIIETHGIQHYLEVNFSTSVTNRSRSLIEEQENDRYKEELAISNGVSKYIVLDCRESKKDYISKSILNSEMSSIFDLSNVDWNLCDIAANKSYYDDILKYYRSGITNSKDIAKLIGLNRATVIKALHKMADNEICDYNSVESSVNHISKANYRRVICLENKKIYESIKSTKQDGYSPKCVSACCVGVKVKTHKGLHWMYYEDYLKKNK